MSNHVQALCLLLELEEYTILLVILIIIFRQFLKHTHRLSFGHLNRCGSQNTVNMHVYSKWTNLIEISGQMRGILCQFGSVFRGEPKSQRLKWIREVLKNAVNIEAVVSALLLAFPSWSKMAAVASAILSGEGTSNKGNGRHFYQENKPFSIIPEIFCSLWLKLCHMVTSSCKWG